MVQKTGLIPALLTLLFISYFSTFASLCLTETGRLINEIKNNYYNRFDYNHLIDTLISDKIFAKSSKFLVSINHLLYIILCVITLRKTFDIFFIKPFSFFNFITNYSTENIKSNNNLYSNISNVVLSDENIIIVLFSFALFLLIYRLYSFIICKKIINILIFVITLILTILTLTYIVNKINIINDKNKIFNVPLLGVDYTYVSK